MEDKDTPTPPLELLAPLPPSSPAAARRIVTEAEIRATLLTDHARDRKPLGQIASELGLPRKLVYGAWRALKENAQKAAVLTPDQRDTLRAYLLGSFEEIMERAMDKMDEHAAYAAIAINAGEKLWERAGLDQVEAATGSDGMKDRLAKLMKAGRKLSPLLTTKPGLASLDPKDVRQAKKDVEQWEEIPTVENDGEGQEPSPPEGRGTL